MLIVSVMLPSASRLINVDVLLEAASRASNTGRGSDVGLIVLIEAGGFYSRKYGISESASNLVGP